jgi:ABC-type phosphate/phosphonate transport system substrate-binding protein
MTPTYVNARMYSPVPGAAAAWGRLFAWLAAETGVPLETLDHPAPRPIAELWARPDLACAFMCGLPFAEEARETGSPRPVVAAPVRTAERAATYRTLFVVRADAPFRTLEDTFGGVLGWTVPDSHSGYSAPRRHLLRYRRPGRDRLYARTVGPLVAPMGVVAAVRDGTVDVGPVDAYAFDLIARHAPETAATVRAVEATDPVPVPPLVSSRGAPADLADRLSARLLGQGGPVPDDLLADLCIDGFARPGAQIYRTALDWVAEAEAAGYPAPA